MRSARVRATDRAERSMSPREAAAALRAFSSGHRARWCAVAAVTAVWVAASAAEPLVLARLVDELAGTRRAGVISACLAAFLGLGLLSAVMVSRRDAVASGIAADVGYDLRKRLLDTELRSLRPSATVEVSAVSGVDGIATLLAWAVPSLGAAMASLTVQGLVACFLDWRVGLVVLCSLAPTVWLSARVSGRRRSATAAATTSTKRLAAEIRGFFSEDGLEHVTAMRARPHVMSRTDPIAAALRAVDRRRFVVGNLYPATKVVGTVLAIAAVGAAWLLGGVSAGTQVGFIFLARQQIEAMLTVVLWYGSFVNEIPHIETVSEGLAVPTEREGGERPERSAGRLEMHDVTAVYPDGRRGLDGARLTVAPGEAIAIVGTSGSGKTSIARFATGSEALAPQAGMALLDGVAIERLELDFLRETCVRVPQGTWVFDGTVKENLLPPDGATSEDLEWACRLALLHDQIAAWPHGYDTLCAVSGGQKQRLGIARALLRVRFGGARILLLDEPTAALEAEASDALLDGVLAYLADAGIAALVITHNLPVHPRLGRVVVVSDGRVIEDGDPRELAADPESAYSRLFGVREHVT